MAGMGYPVDPCDPRVLALDPLDFDRRLPGLWEMNAAADVNDLVVMLRSMVPERDALQAMTLQQCVAVMRDLGILLGSLKRHGVEPVEAVPEVEEPLLDLGSRAQMIPRDTVHHYIGWNPGDSRQRMYTGDRMERMLMSSVRVTLHRLGTAVEVCERLRFLDPHQVEFAVAVNELVALIRSLEDAIDIVTANVTPEFFARTMRPYFEEIRVGAVTYLGPAAAHVPLSLIDLGLWAADAGDQDYDEFWRESAQYGLPPWQPLYEDWARGPSLVTRVVSMLESVAGGEVSTEMRASTESLCRALRALVVFRGKHLTVARAAYAEELRLYSLGSGGASIELLDQVTVLTKENAGMLRQYLSRRKAPLAEASSTGRSGTR